MMPCRHMCVIINNPIYYTAGLFNVCWYIAYNYYFQRSFSSEKVPNVCKSLELLHDATINQSFSLINGEYNGIYVKDTDFFKSIPPFQGKPDISTDEIYKFMIDVQEATISGPVIAGTIKIGLQNEYDYEQSNDRINDMSKIVPATMGGTSTVTSVLSQERQAMNDIASKDPFLGLTIREKIKPMFDEAVRSSKTLAQAEKLLYAIRECHYQNIAEQHEKNKIKRAGSTIFGAENYTKKTNKRHKFAYERSFK